MVDYHQYQTCIDACLRCASVCNHCASSCTKEKNVQMMARCIQLDMECASICYAAAQVMSLGGEKAMEIASSLKANVGQYIKRVHYLNSDYL